MDFIAHVLTAWTGDGATVAYHPAIADDYALQAWSDVTGQDASVIIPDVNLFVVEIRCDAATMEAISNDARYQVIWSEEQTDQAA